MLALFIKNRVYLRNFNFSHSFFLMVSIIALCNFKMFSFSSQLQLRFFCLLSKDTKYSTNIIRPVT